MPKCTICGSLGTNRSTCPDNPNISISRQNPIKHNLAQRSSASASASANTTPSTNTSASASTNTSASSSTSYGSTVGRGTIYRPSQQMRPPLTALPRLWRCPRPRSQGRGTVSGHCPRVSPRTPPMVPGASPALLGSGPSGSGGSGGPSGPSQEQILQSIMWENARKGPTPPTPQTITETTNARTTPLEQLALLHSDMAQLPSNHRTEWDYLISLFTDVEKVQRQELETSGLFSQSGHENERNTGPNGSSKGPTLSLTFFSGAGDPIKIQIRQDQLEEGISVPNNFLGIKTIPCVRIGSQKVRLALPQLLEIEYQKAEQEQEQEQDPDYIEILESIQSHLS